MLLSAEPSLQPQEEVFNPGSLDLESPKLHGKYILGLFESLMNTAIIAFDAEGAPIAHSPG